MKSNWINLLLVVCLLACDSGANKAPSILGTWELVSAIKKEDGKEQNTFVSSREMIKIITPTHFSFINHDLNKGEDSTAFFSAGAGTYILEGNVYIEQLEYCIARSWEGHQFSFEVELKGDSLIQKGVEQSEELGVDRYIIETYVRKE